MRLPLARRTLACLAAIAILAALPTSSHAAWGLDGAPVCTASGTQQTTQAIPDGAGGTFVAWVDYRSGTFDADIRVQRLNAAGQPQWSLNGVAAAAVTGSLETDVRICSDGAGGVLLVWTDGRNDIDRDIYAQRVLANGTTAWGTNGVGICTLFSVTPQSNQLLPAIAPDGAGGAFLAWEDRRGGALDVYAQHVNASGGALWAVNGVPVCTSPGIENGPRVVSGQAGSCVVAWTDYRDPAGDVYAQRLDDPAGAPAWTVNGVPVCAMTGAQTDVRAIPDGAGAMLVWRDERSGTGDHDVYAQRIDAASGAALWSPSGLAVCALAGSAQSNAAIVASGTGALVAWDDARGGPPDVYAQRLDANGSALWPANGVAACTASGAQDLPVAAADGSGGAFLAWRDARGGATRPFAQWLDASGAAQWPADGVAASTIAGGVPRAAIADGSGALVVALEAPGPGAADVFAQRVLADGSLADYGVTLVTAADLPGDEGGWMRLTFDAAIGDLAPGVPSVIGYSAWRLVAPGPAAGTARFAPAAERERAGARVASAMRRPVRLEPAEAAAAGFPAGTWESVASTFARATPSYAMAVPTPTDSTAQGAADQTFVITAHSTLSTVYGVSAQLVGHSVDNLAPAAPQALAGSVPDPGVVRLEWDASPEPDVAHYAVYRGATGDFVPSPGNRLGAPAAPTFDDDDAVGPAWYKVSAVDRHGNESPFATLEPGQVVGVGPGPVVARELRLLPPAPNPSGGDVTSVFFTLPRAAAVRLVLLDVTGRRIRRLLDGRFEAGDHRAVLRLRDGSSPPLPAGLYLLRLETGGESRTQRLVVG